MNGTTPTAATLATAMPVTGRLDLRAWRAITERALGHVREQRAHVARDAERLAGELQRLEAERVRLETEAAFLERVLELPTQAPPPASKPTLPPARTLELPDLPPPPAIRKGSRSGKGRGGRAAGYLLEVARIRARVQAEQRTGVTANAPIDLALDGAEALTWDVIRLACKGWASTTVGMGLRRLVDDGYLERTLPGVYALTEYGLAAAPGRPGRLALTDPGPNGGPDDGAALVRVGEPAE